MKYLLLFQWQERERELRDLYVHERKKQLLLKPPCTALAIREQAPFWLTAVSTRYSIPTAGSTSGSETVWRPLQIPNRMGFALKFARRMKFSCRTLWLLWTAGSCLGGQAAEGAVCPGCPHTVLASIPRLLSCLEPELLFAWFEWAGRALSWAQRSPPLRLSWAHSGFDPVTKDNLKASCSRLGAGAIMRPVAVMLWRLSLAR